MCKPGKGLKPHLVAIFETLPHFAQMNKYAVKWTFSIQLVVGCCVWEKGLSTGLLWFEICD
jgi:hypothetical protein